MIFENKSVGLGEQMVANICMVHIGLDTNVVWCIGCYFIKGGVVVNLENQGNQTRF